MFFTADTINILDVVLEGAKALIMVVLVIIIWGAGRKFPQLSGGSWNLIIFGFMLMAVGFFFDFSDELINYESAEMPSIISTLQSIIEEGCLIGGLLLVTIGFKKWFNFVGRFLGLKSET